MLNSRYFALLVLAALTIASGAIQGNATFRWGIPIELQHAADQLHDCNLEVGNWKLKERQQFNRDVQRLLKPAGYIKHVYENEVTNEVVVVAIFVGPTGPIVAHTPIVCYPASAFELYSQPYSTTFEGYDGSKHELHAVTFRAGNIHRNYLRVYYGWSDIGGEYQAPVHPRVAFADRSFLTRIQVATILAVGKQDKPEDAAVRFLEQLLSRQSP